MYRHIPHRFQLRVFIFSAMLAAHFLGCSVPVDFGLERPQADQQAKKLADHGIEAEVTSQGKRYAVMVPPSQLEAAKNVLARPQFQEATRSGAEHERHDETHTAPRETAPSPRTQTGEDVRAPAKHGGIRDLRDYFRRTDEPSAEPAVHDQAALARRWEQTLGRLEHVRRADVYVARKNGVPAAS